MSRESDNVLAALCREDRRYAGSTKQRREFVRELITGGFHRIFIVRRLPKLRGVLYAEERG